MGDLGTDHLLIVRRIKVIDEPLDHFIFHHGRKHLRGQLASPLGMLKERFNTFLFFPLENCAVRSYLGIESVILQECIGHLSLARGLFQSQIPCGRRASQAMRENLAKQRMIAFIGCHLSTKQV